MYCFKFNALSVKEERGKSFIRQRRAGKIAYPSKKRRENRLSVKEERGKSLIRQRREWKILYPSKKRGEIAYPSKKRGENRLSVKGDGENRLSVKEEREKSLIRQRREGKIVYFTLSFVTFLSLTSLVSAVLLSHLLYVPVLMSTLSRLASSLSFLLRSCLINFRRVSKIAKGVY